MKRTIQLAVLALTCGIAAPNSTKAGIQLDKDEIFDCNNPASKFENIVCSNPGVFDMINHNHQRFKYVPSPQEESTIKLRKEYYTLVGDLEKLCPPDNARAAAACMQDFVQGPAMLSFDKRIDKLYENIADIEGDEECDGCEDIPAEESISNTAASSFQVDDPSDQSPMDFVRRLQEGSTANAQDEVAKFFNDFWSGLGSGKSSVPDQNSEPDTGWDVTDKSEPLTGASTQFARKTFDYEGASIEVALSCDASKKQILFSATDRTDAINELNIPNAATHMAEVKTRFLPSPPGFPDNEVFNSGAQSFGRTFTLIGFNPNNWGIGFCQSGPGYAPNSPFCQQKDVSLPDQIRKAAQKNNASVTDLAFKKRDFVPARWSDFEEIRYSLRTVWGNPAAGQMVPQQYFFSIFPNKQPLKSLFDACERHEDRCVAIAGEKEAKACRNALLKEMTNG